MEMKDNNMDFNTAKICVAGIGGIGGMLAGMLGRKYDKNLSLIAHGEHLKKLQQQGVILHSDFYGDSVTHPAVVTEQGEEIGTQDFIFVCVKNYSLEELAGQLRPAVGPDTVLIPVMNGVEPGDHLRKLFPEAIVVDALIYTISAAEPDGSTKQSGKYTHIFLGSKEQDARHVDASKQAYALLKSCGFDARYTEDIESEIWQKYILNCGFNTITARYLICSGDIRKNTKYQEDLHAILREANAVGLALHVHLPEGLADTKFHFVMTAQQDTATSSMRRDVEAHRRTELDAFLGALIRKGKETGVPTPVAARYYAELSEIIDGYLKK
ncbi:ketopantoate reductase family protein [Oribacterium sp. HCP28S3_H8]|uniref:ketopantoate reductase family protein n=1 Tax=Oribacterium sp. HCP28S3_H8 TaxID=3438945 RepID=UPI003F8C5767